MSDTSTHRVEYILNFVTFKFFTKCHYIENSYKLNQDHTESLLYMNSRKLPWDLLNMGVVIGAYVFLASLPGDSNAYQGLRITTDVS